MPRAHGDSPVGDDPRDTALVLDPKPPVPQPVAQIGAGKPSGECVRVRQQSLDESRGAADGDLGGSSPGAVGGFSGSTDSGAILGHLGYHGLSVSADTSDPLASPVGCEQRGLR